jgi:serine/threonine-protein kinase HipA
MTNIPIRCPITYELLEPGQKYSVKGLHSLSPALETLNDLPFSAEELRREALQRAPKMSIQGVQFKMSAILKPSEGRFEIVDQEGRYILKPPHEFYPEVPENEDVSMRLAAMIGIEVPLHGLVYAKDGSRTYFIKRFDREPRGQKLALEDFAQLAGETRDTKYNYTMEKVAALIERFSTFPVLDKRELFLRTLFNFLIGNEDMHLKNFSLITRDGKVEMAPAYDFLNSTIALSNAREELALPLRGKKARLKRSDLIDYFAGERMHLNSVTIEETLHRIKEGLTGWEELLQKSFLTLPMKDQYLALIQKRRAVLDI